jgi:hypothetical protein
MNKYKLYFATHNKRQLNKILTLSADIFNGYTLTDSVGGWKDNNGKLIKENSYILTIITDKAKEVQRLPDYINWIAKQDCTILEQQQTQIKFIN